MNAYEILGLTSQASDDDVKSSYRRLAKKYHPDNFAENPDIAKIMTQKMLELNEAYDAINRARKIGAEPDDVKVTPVGQSESKSHSESAQSEQSQARQQPRQQAQQQGSPRHTHQRAGEGKRQKRPSARANAQESKYNNTYSTETNFPEIRRLILEQKFDDAEAVLTGVSTERRDAEWHFLKGAVTYQKGQLEQAYTYLQTAVSLAPTNSEYRAAFNQASNMRNGSSGGYKVDGRDRGGCDLCNMCCSLICADQCCECCGGDLISCC